MNHVDFLLSVPPLLSLLFGVSQYFRFKRIRGMNMNTFARVCRRPTVCWN